MASLLARFVTEAWGYTEMACSNPFAFTKARGYEKLAYHTGSLCNRGMGLHRNGLFEPICFYQGGTKNWHTTL